MTRLHKNVNKLAPKELRSPGERKLAEENISTHESLDRRMNPQIQTEDEAAIPLPDEEELARIRRRRAASRGGGRSSTVLSEDRFGP